MELLLISFIAGILTVLAPCILPVLPVVIGGSLHGVHDRLKPLIITGSLGASVIIFTLLLKFSTAFIDVPQRFWSTMAGIILIVFGLTSLFPRLWEVLALRFNFGGKSEQLLAASAQKKNRWGDVLIGLSLGPVFSSCSPTYFVILATVLPQSFARGLLDLVAYAIGLSLVLLLIAFLGQKFVQRVRWAANPEGWFKRGLGLLFIVVGVAILTGLDKELSVYILDRGFFDITRIEMKLLE